MRRFRNAPLGRTLIGVALGVSVFAAHRGGLFNSADFAALDFTGAFAPSLVGDQSLVLVVSPGTDPSGHATPASVEMRRTGLNNALAAGAAVVGIEERFLANGSTDEAPWPEARDLRCVIVSPGGRGVPAFRQLRRRQGVSAVTMEQVCYEGGVARRVKAVIPGDLHGRAPGFVAEVVTRASQTHRTSGSDSRALEENLRRLASARGILIDYSLPASAISRISLGALAEGPVAAIRPLVVGRVVLLSAAPGAGHAPGSSADLSAPPSHRGVDSQPVAAWAVAALLAGPGIREPNQDLYGSALVLLAVVLMLSLSDRSLRGKLTGALVALLAILAIFLAGRVGLRVFIPPWPAVGTVLVAFVATACLELSEAGHMIDREFRAQPGGVGSLTDAEQTSPRAQVERALQSIVRWHDLPAAALALGPAARPPRLATVVGDGPVRWHRAPSLHSLATDSMKARAPVLGTWPSAAARDGHWHALAVPVVGWAGQAMSLILASPRLPVSHEAVEFGVRAARQSLAERAPGAEVPVTSAADADRLPLPKRLAWLRSARMGRQRQAALAAAWRSSVHEAVVLFDMAGKPVLWNRRAEALFGAEEEDLAGSHFVPLLARASGLSPEEARQAATDVLVHGTPLICDIEDPTGKYNYVAVLTQVAVDGDAPGGLAIRCIDVTGVCRPARVEARLMSVAAHEMRTPLTSILGYAELLLGQTGTGSLSRRYAAAIHRQAGRVESIVRELLAVTRLEAGTEELVIEPVDVTVLARSVVASLEPMARDHGVSLSVTRDGGQTEIRGDVRKLERVVENLITNAVKYSPPGASVMVNTRRAGDRVVLAITDTGYGIATKDVPHVFEKFYRAKNRHTQSVAGTGLGLSIVKLIVEVHGGEVTLRSAVGAGSTFTIRLPVAGPRSTQASTSAA